MKKYFIKGLFSDWKEVEKGKFDAYKNHIINGCMCKINLPQILKNHCKIVEEKET